MCADERQDFLPQRPQRNTEGSRIAEIGNEELNHKRTKEHKGESGIAIIATQFWSGNVL
jgi:hypothetical protein